MTTIDELRNKKLKDITADDLQDLVLSGDEQITIKRTGHFAYIDGLTMEFVPVGSWRFSFGRMSTYIFHFARFSDMPKALQDLWKEKTGDNEPELKI